MSPELFLALTIVLKLFTTSRKGTRPLRLCDFVPNAARNLLFGHRPAPSCVGVNACEKLIKKMEDYSLIRPLKEIKKFSCNSTFLHEFFDTFWVPLPP